ncbi:hypothetical protein T484DRAFT_1941279 [Baffinella frigidus]|nr:hypothetical protein T484DRAFT_1941279 [Cryptophyta sp. CCMP2293]
MVVALFAKLMAVKNPLVTSALVCYGVNAAGFSVTAATHTHMLTDLTGTGAFVLSAAATYAAFASQHAAQLPGKPMPLRPLILAAAVSLWGMRLGGFLFNRILNSPEDKRLTEFFPKKGELPIRLLGFWTIQASWAYVSLLPVTMAMTVPPLRTAAALGPAGMVALAGFSVGFLCESIADHQKSVFKALPGKKNRPCTVGLWHYSRHPNYFGEMLVWWSLWGLSAAPMWTVASPLFVTFLLTQVSGIPLLEKKYDKVYATDKEYQEYKSTTSLLIPLPKFSK